MKLRESICEAIDILCADVAQKITNEEKELKIKAWHMNLKSLTDEQIYKGLDTALNANSDFVPSSGKFKEYCLIDNGLISIESEAMMAWSLAYSNLNYYSSPIFKNNVISETIRQMGGWKNFCSMQTKEEPFIKKEFIAIYTSMKKRGIEYAHELIGEFRELKFIGFDSQEEINELKEQFLRVEQKSKKMLAMLYKKGEK